MAAMLKKVLTLSAALLVGVATWATAVDLRKDHPDSYVVQKGDTLWDIAAKFLQKPWLWPEIWQANPQIENPHLIFPGDVISLSYLDGQARLGVTKLSPQVRRTPNEAVTAVPLSAVEAFLVHTRVIGEGEYQSLPYVVGLEDARLRSTSGQVAYVRRLGDARPGDRFAVMRPTVRYVSHPVMASGRERLRGDPWDAGKGVDPNRASLRWSMWEMQDNGVEALGYELVEVGTGTLTRGGDPATLLLTGEGMEVRTGDLLMPVEQSPFDLTFQPRAPDRVPAGARVMAVSDALQTGGPGRVVALNLGRRNGIEPGHVLSINRPGELVEDRVEHPQPIRSKRKPNMVQLPDQFVGHVMVFRTFDKVSYGLVVDGIKPASVGDRLKAPDYY